MLGFRMDMPLSLMTLYSSLAIAVTMLLRLALKRPLPKTVFPAFWALIMVRLLVPFSISSPLSYRAPVLPTLKPSVPFEINRPNAPAGQMTMVPAQTVPQLDWSVIVSILFCIGMVVTIVVFLLQKRHYDKKLRDCLPLTENQAVNACLREMGMEKTLVFTSDHITTPLVHGLINPKIYMPAEMNFTESKLVRHILLHELTHIKHGHNWLKTVMLVVLCLNWYNPLVWMMAYCMGADLESACDAAVMKKTSGNERHDYAKSLLAMSLTEKRSALIYSSFAKTAVEQRIKGVLRYRRASSLALAVSVLLLGASTVAVATVGQAEFSPELSSHHQTASGRWLLRGDKVWDVPLGENAQERADHVMAQLLSEDNTDDLDQLEQKLQNALAKEFRAPAMAFTLWAQLTLPNEAFDAEYAANGMTTDELGRYLYEGEMVRSTNDPVRGFGRTNPLGTVDVVILRNSSGSITAISAYREGDEAYDNHTKNFPK